MPLNIDWAFIARQEGAAITEGYVPRANDGTVAGQSGVTIATGFDLGQHDRAYLDRVLSGHADIIRLLAPYLGLKRSRAVAALAATPLTITDAQAQIIDRAVKTDKANALVPIYDNAVTVLRKPALLRFTALPREAQTVIMSVAFQYGNLPTRTPRFWRIVVRQDWQAAVAELRAFGDAYGQRRQREARYLSALLVTN